MERFGGGLSCRKRTDAACYQRRRDREGIGGLGPKTSSALSIFGGRASPGVEGGEALGAGYGHEQPMESYTGPTHL